MRPRVSASRPVGRTLGASRDEGRRPEAPRTSARGMTLGTIEGLVKAQPMILSDRMRPRSNLSVSSPVSTAFCTQESMTASRFPVAVIIERVPLANRWISEQWRVADIECSADAATAPVRLDFDGPGERWRFAGHTIELHRSEAEGYFLNITAPDPKVFVMWRMIEDVGDSDVGPRIRPQLVTVSYNEAARFLDGGEQVDAVPLPVDIRDWVQPFVAEHYRPEPKRKNRRNELYEREGNIAPTRKSGP